MLLKQSRFSSSPSEGSLAAASISMLMPAKPRNPPNSCEATAIDTPRRLGWTFSNAAKTCRSSATRCAARDSSDTDNRIDDINPPIRIPCSRAAPGAGAKGNSESVTRTNTRTVRRIPIDAVDSAQAMKSPADKAISQTVCGCGQAMSSTVNTTSAAWPSATAIVRSRLTISPPHWLFKAVRSHQALAERPGAKNEPMPLIRERLHTRSVEFNGYRRSDGLWDIEAELKDSRHYDTQVPEKGFLPAGEALPHMTIVATLDDQLVVKAITARMLSTPFTICSEIQDSLQAMEGAQIGAGWRRAVSDRL